MNTLKVGDHIRVIHTWQSPTDPMLAVLAGTYYTVKELYPDSVLLELPWGLQFQIADFEYAKFFGSLPDIIRTKVDPKAAYKPGDVLTCIRVNALFTVGKNYKVISVNKDPYGTLLMFENGYVVPLHEVPHYFIVSDTLKPASPIKCTCGSSAVGSSAHSSWCDLQGAA